MRKHAEQGEVGHNSVPDIVCGLDKLQWQTVKETLTDDFNQTKVSVTAGMKTPRTRTVFGKCAWARQQTGNKESTGNYNYYSFAPNNTGNYQILQKRLLKTHPKSHATKRLEN